jgi:hypothetical protein
VAAKYSGMMYCAIHRSDLTKAAAIFVRKLHIPRSAVFTLHTINQLAAVTVCKWATEVHGVHVCEAAAQASGTPTH